MKLSHGIYSSLCVVGVTCDERYNSIENGNAIGRHVESSCRNSYNCKLTFSCNYGFELNSGKSTKVVVCKADGTWSGLKPVCQRELFACLFQSCLLFA